MWFENSVPSNNREPLQTSGHSNPVQNLKNESKGNTPFLTLVGGYRLDILIALGLWTNFAKYAVDPESLSVVLPLPSPGPAMALALN